MTSSTLHPTPSWRHVILAHLRAVGVMLRPPLVVAGVLGITLAVISGLAALRDQEGIPFVPELALLPVLTACLLPVAVWRNEYDVRRSYLASLPVEPVRHILAKLTAGWAWLMALTVTFMLSMLALTMVTGGSIGVDEMRILASDLPAGVSNDEAVALARHWKTPGWQWTVFFTTPTIGYLIGSAIVLAGSRTRRWLTGIAVLAAFFVVLAEQGFAFGGVALWVVDGLKEALAGRYGFMSLFAAVDAYTLRTVAGGELFVWTSQLTMAAWALTTVLWGGLAAASLAAVLWSIRKN
jgi:hypothetical protein